MIKTKILLVDDDDDYRQSLRGFLELEGYLIEVAASFEAAHHKMITLQFDLILADLRLVDDNDIKGLEVARMATEMQVPCIIITGFPSVETTKLALRTLGLNSLAIDYVLKKDGPDAVLSAINKLSGISFLHISDLHPKMEESGEVHFDQEQAYSEFLNDVMQQPGLALNPIRTTLVSGDISFQGKAESFEWAQRFLDKLALNLTIPKNQIVLTPGNHDINRTKAQLVHDSLHSIEVGDTLWFDKFDNYLNFTSHFYGQPAFSRQKLYRIFKFDERVAVVAFNSCIIEGDPKWKCDVCFTRTGKQHFHGWIDRHQVQQAAEELDQEGWKGLRIGVFHHHTVPDDWQPFLTGCQGDHLWSFHQKDQRLKFTFSAGGFPILLYGHRHKVELRQTQSVGSNVPYQFGSGAFWKTTDQQSETANYLLLQLSPMLGRSRVVMRRYNPATNERAGYWGFDDSIQPNGIIPLPSIVIPSVESKS